MKKRHSFSQNIKSYLRMVKEGYIRYDLPIQRSKGQWTRIDQSLLIHSIIKDYDIPPIYSNSTRVEGPGVEGFQYSILDGIQRLSTIEDFCSNKFALSSDTPPVRLQSEYIEIANLHMDELPQNFQEIIYDYTLSMYYFVNMTEEELIEMFYRIGCGTTSNKQQRSKAHLGLKKAQNLNDLTDHIFFKEFAKLTASQCKKADDEKIIIQALMLLDSSFDEYMAFDSKTIEKYMIYLRTSENEELFDELEIALQYLYDTLVVLDTTPDTILKKRYLTYIIYIAAKAYACSVDEQDFSEWLLNLEKAVTVEDTEHMKSLFSLSAKNKTKLGIQEIKHELETTLIK